MQRALHLPRAKHVDQLWGVATRWVEAARPSRVVRQASLNDAPATSELVGDLGQVT